jgi:hypothetical protein
MEVRRRFQQGLTIKKPITPRVSAVASHQLRFGAAVGGAAAARHWAHIRRSSCSVTHSRQ